jgi:FKBP-type peptidyl-prolyl cis-trans isomerase
VKGKGIVQAKAGYIVRIHYVGKLDYGAAFHTSIASGLANSQLVMSNTKNSKLSSVRYS